VLNWVLTSFTGDYNSALCDSLEHLCFTW